MLKNTSPDGHCLAKREPNKSLFAMLTPQTFKNNPHSRLYGWLMNEYKTTPSALARHLPHIPIPGHSPGHWPPKP